MRCIIKPWHLLRMENYKKIMLKQKIQISGPIWDKEFELSDGSYSISDIQNCFEYINKKDETQTDNFPIQIYVNRIENRITFKIKTGYYL